MKDVLSAEDRMRKLMAQRTPAERLQMCSRMFAGAKTLMRAGMARKQGGAEVPDLRRQLFLRLYGADFSENQRDTILKAPLRSSPPPFGDSVLAEPVPDQSTKLRMREVVQGI
jgi:hypothetical protein